MLEGKQQYRALVSPQGHVEYNADFVLGSAACEKLEHGKIYTNEELDKISPGFCIGNTQRHIKKALFLKDSSNAIEKNIKKWRFEIQGYHA
ncbi:MAG: hypothetical protein SFX19_10095 [Alphaproteobacteria bacterium]|nr:hypothetical protein [Alphaproteobacteria bacterium]